MPYPIPATRVKMVVFLEFSSRVTLSARTVLTTMLRPAQPMPKSALPNSNIGKAVTGDPAHSALPINMATIAACKAAYLPYTSAICPHAGMKVADVRLNAVTIQFS
jgi:hypothetical protein